MFCKRLFLYIEENMNTPENIRNKAYSAARQLVRNRLAENAGTAYENLNSTEKKGIDRAVDIREATIKKIALKLIPQMISRNSSEKREFNESLNEKFEKAIKPLKKKEEKGAAKSPHIEIHNTFGEEVALNSAVYKALVKKSNSSGVDVDILGEVYNRGMNVWNENTNVSQQQYAFARVNSFINQGKTYFKEDSDLAEEIKTPSRRKTKRFIETEHDVKAGQTYGDKPYSSHPKMVERNIKKFFGTKGKARHARIAALLHDVVEDTPTTPEALLKKGHHPDVVKAVQLLSKDKTKSYEDNIENIASGTSDAHHIAKMVKYADNYANFSAKPKSEWNNERTATQKQKYYDSMKRLGRELGVNHHEKIKDMHNGVNITEEKNLDEETENFKKGDRVYLKTRATANSPHTGQAVRVTDTHVYIKTLGGTGMYKAPHSSVTKDRKKSYLHTTYGDKNEEVESNKPSDREYGTDSLKKIYKKDTPGQKLDESFNMAFDYQGKPTLAPTAHELMMKTQGGFAHHYDVQDVMNVKSIKEQIEKAFQATILEEDKDELAISMDSLINMVNEAFTTIANIKSSNIERDAWSQAEILKLERYIESVAAYINNMDETVRSGETHGVIVPAHTIVSQRTGQSITIPAKSKKVKKNDVVLHPHDNPFDGK